MILLAATVSGLILADRVAAVVLTGTIVIKAQELLPANHGKGGIQRIELNDLDVCRVFIHLISLILRGNESSCCLAIFWGAGADTKQPAKTTPIWRNVEHERQQRYAKAQTVETTIATWNDFNTKLGSFADEHSTL